MFLIQSCTGFQEYIQLYPLKGGGNSAGCPWFVTSCK